MTGRDTAQLVPLHTATLRPGAPTTQLNAATSQLDAPTRKIVVFTSRLDAPTIDFDAKTQTSDPLIIEIDAATIQIVVFTLRIDASTLIFDAKGQIWPAQEIFEVVNGLREQFPRVKDLLGVLGLSLTIFVAEALEVATSFRHELATNVAQPFESVFVMNRG